MNDSVAKKLFWGMACLILFHVGLNWLLNAQLLERYYLYAKETQLVEQGRALALSYERGPEDVQVMIEQLEAGGISVFITAADGSERYSSIKRLTSGSGLADGGGVEAGAPQRRISDYFVRRRQAVDKDITLEWQQDPVVSKTNLAMEMRLDNGDRLRLWRRLSSVAESAALINHFMMLTGGVSLLVGLAWIIFFTRRFTAPIVGLRNAAQAMARLDFSRKCRVKEGDELGELAVSLNDLSERLAETIQALSDKNKALTKAVERERELDGLRKSFIANVSHELKTPIALILGYGEGLRANVAEDEASRRYYSEVIIDEAKKMDKLVKELLTLAKMESCSQPLRLAPIAVDRWLLQLQPKMTALAKERSVDLSVDSAAAEVVIDVDKLEQAVMNLASNAICHAAGEEKTVRISTEARNGWVRLSVFNSGAPIPDKIQNCLWDSFYRADEARVRETGRVGLGLSIVRAIQERHGAAYGMENVEGGVRFWLDLRVQDGGLSEPA